MIVKCSLCSKASSKPVEFLPVERKACWWDEAMGRTVEEALSEGCKKGATVPPSSCTAVLGSMDEPPAHLALAASRCACTFFWSCTNKPTGWQLKYVFPLAPFSISSLLISQRRAESAWRFCYRTGQGNIETAYMRICTGQMASWLQWRKWEQIQSGILFNEMCMYLTLMRKQSHDRWCHEFCRSAGLD